MKKIAAILLCLAMIWSLGPMCVAAADNQAFITGVYQKNEGSLELLCAIPGRRERKRIFRSPWEIRRFLSCQQSRRERSSFQRPCTV